MNKTISIILAAMLVLIVPLVSAFDTNTATELSVREVRSKDSLMEKIPETYEVAAKEMSILPVQKRFLLYSNDGKHVMWGELANGYFKGKDNHGKYTWGIYGNDVFAGFYDGKFFWGRYRNGNWVAYGLFNMRSIRGKYIVFPTITTQLATADVAKI